MLAAKFSNGFCFVQLEFKCPFSCWCSCCFEKTTPVIIILFIPNTKRTMGGQESKIEQPSNQEEDHQEDSQNVSTPSTPILTPLDPRSPSANIARTPLELILRGETIENSPNIIENATQDTNETVNLVLGIDPRSPTVEFNRTPIIVGAVTKEKQPKLLKNKNLDNVRKFEIQTTPKAVEKKSIIVPPKLLSTSPVSLVTNYNKRKSVVGLLETNIDFTETDLDSVQAKANLNASLPVEIPEDLPSNKLKSQMENLQVDSTNNWIPDKLNEEAEPKELDEKLTEEKEINVTAQVKDFDKKLTNLIYEDENEDDNKLTPRLAKVRENNRTPLSVRNGNEVNKKAASKLRVSDKPRKSESRIPVLKDNPRRIGVQCENTPPMNMHSKTPHWDADKTLII
ncbi:cell division cycle-associated protein 3-like [Tribolium madens]|uniref:cell division cycle-associated protein 3-like n=1 Tax=Tribolium madens TaxID=41895 RepID=UPI001CF7652A|nr:cell division cycle-associated protein 3-like [Tribolium madens]